MNTSLSGTFTFTQQEISCFIDCLFRIATLSSMDRALPYVIKYNYLQHILDGLRFVYIKCRPLSELVLCASLVPRVAIQIFSRRLFDKYSNEGRLLKDYQIICIHSC